MAIVINGSGTVTGLAVGGLPDGVVDAGTLATNSVGSAELIDGAIDTAHIAADQITSAILPTNTILQMTQSVTTTVYTLGVASSWTAVGFSHAITPSSTSSKILIQLTTSYTSMVNDTTAGIDIYRNGSQMITNSESNYWGMMPHYVYSASQCDIGTGATYLDSPSSTSAVTYSLYYKSDKANFKINGHRPGHMIMILTEIKG